MSLILTIVFFTKYKNTLLKRLNLALQQCNFAIK